MKIFIVIIALLIQSIAFCDNFLTLNNESHAASFNSEILDTRYSNNFSVYVKWTETVSSLVGNIKLQASVDNSNREDINGASTNINGSGSVMFNITNAGYFSLRTVYTRVSGTGTFYIVANKRISGI